MELRQTSHFAQGEEGTPAYGGTLVTATNADPATLNGAYRYELFGRSFVPSDVLREMSASMIPLGSIAEPAS